MVGPKDQFALPGTLPSKSHGQGRAALSRREAIYDAELVRRFNRGDETTFVTIMLRYRERLFSVAVAVLRNYADAEEAREVLMGEFSDLVAQCMLRLAPPQREILAMRVTRRHNYAEIAQQLHISICTVKSRIARARESLRLLMCEVCPEFHSSERHAEWFEPVRHTGGIMVIGV